VENLENKAWKGFRWDKTIPLYIYERIIAD
jgi:hypothetical protein